MWREWGCVVVLCPLIRSEIGKTDGSAGKGWRECGSNTVALLANGSWAAGASQHIK